MYPIKKYNLYNLPVGAKYSTCPICSSERKKRNQKCLLIDWNRGLATCQHCGKVLQLHSYQNKNEPKTIYMQSGIVHNKKIIPYQFDITMVKKSLSHYYQNNFVKFLNSLFNPELVKTLIEKYNIGTSRKWQGACIFWQKDIEGVYRTGKIMLYQENGERVKNPYNKINWAHKFVDTNNNPIKQCLFGEHLIKKGQIFVLVESEKNAIIGSAYFPEYCWLAVGGKENLSLKLLSPLKNMKLIIIPDSDSQGYWESKMPSISKELNIEYQITDFIYQKSTNLHKKKGYDVADFLIENNGTKKRTNEKMPVHISVYIDKYFV